jgi:hypothetical protein
LVSSKTIDVAGSASAPDSAIWALTVLPVGDLIEHQPGRGARAERGAGKNDAPRLYAADLPPAGAGTSTCRPATRGDHLLRMKVSASRVRTASYGLTPGWPMVD